MRKPRCSKRKQPLRRQWWQSRTNEHGRRYWRWHIFGLVVYLELDNNPPWVFDSADESDQHGVIAALLKTQSAAEPKTRAMQIVVWRWKLAAIKAAAQQD
jgi:hypothetical protein